MRKFKKQNKTIKNKFHFNTTCNSHSQHISNLKAPHSNRWDFYLFLPGSNCTSKRYLSLSYNYLHPKILGELITVTDGKSLRYDAC